MGPQPQAQGRRAGCVGRLPGAQPSRSPLLPSSHLALHKASETASLPTCLSRYLYVNSRAWPEGCVVSDPLQPPPIAEEIELRVVDLKTMKEAKRALRAHRAYTPSEEFNFIFLDVSRDFVAR